jgi:uncharacterized protein
MGARVVHFEIGCRDAKAASRFYREVFNWSVTDEGDSVSIDTGTAPNDIGGHINSRESEPYNYTIFYVEVDDIEEAVLKVEALGGKTLLPILPIPSGRFTWIQDVEGNTIGLFQQ